MPNGTVLHIRSTTTNGFLEKTKLPLATPQLPESMAPAAYVAILFLSFLFLFSLLGHRHRKINGENKRVQRLPPSPPAIPVLGHLHLLGKPIHAALARLAERYGPVFSLRLGSREAVVVTSAACARECFTEHDVCFANRPRFPSLLLISFGGATLPM